MAILAGFGVRNFGVLKNVKLGLLWNDGEKTEPLTPMTAVIGKNGVGKSALFDAFGFLADALKTDVEAACDARGRGGFEKIRSRGVVGPIQFNVCYREHENAQLIRYHIAIEADAFGRPYVLREFLTTKGTEGYNGHPFLFLLLQKGVGIARPTGYQIPLPVPDESGNLETQWKGSGARELVDEGELTNDKSLDLLDVLKSIKSKESGKKESGKTEIVELENPRKLGLATLGAFKQHPRISAFRQFIEDWYVSYFTPDAARSLPLAGPQKHLNIHGDNLGNVVQFMEREHPERFQSILKKIADKIPGINRIDTERTRDGRLLLRFNDKGFQDPFYAQQMSDGTLKLFAYLLLLEDPSPPSFLCIEEPENGLYHKLLEVLACEFRKHADRREGGSQIFVTTHQPYFVSALNPQEVWILDKGEDGFSTIRRASEDPLVNNLVDEGLPLGGLWHSDYLEPR